MSKTIYSTKKTHYIYLLIDQDHKKYGGVRTCEGIPENDEYMSSSSLVNEAIENGKVFKKHIIKTFDTRIEANEYEENWLKRMNAGYNDKWYNQTNGDKKFCVYGKKRTEESRKKQSKARKGQVPWNKGRKMPPRTDEWKRKQSEAKKGKKKPPITDEHRRKLSEAKKEWWRLKKIKEEK